MKLFIVVAPLVVLSSLVMGQTVVKSQTCIPSCRSPIADSTLGTQVTGAAGNFDITGGMSRGGHLFHSFQDFSVPTNGGATFANPAGNQSIITRVTGSLFSDINGTINTHGANFLLINPNGVVFGPGTQLNVGGIFAVSTANSLDLADGKGGVVTFSTKPTLASDAFLTVNPSALFNVSRFNLGGGSGEIKNFGMLQTTNANQYIGLIGGNVSIDGGKIMTPGGRVELGGLSAPGAVEFTNNKVVFPVGVARSDVSLKNSSTVDVRSIGGGNITINASNISLAGGSSLLGGVSGVGTSLTFAGDIILDAIGVTTIDSDSKIKNAVRTNSVGSGGNINIKTGSLSLNNGAVVSAETAGKGKTGNVIVNAADKISLDNATIVNSIEAGGVEILQDDSGRIELNGNSLSLLNGATVQTVTSTSDASSSIAGKGNAGNINANISGEIKISGRGDVLPSGIYSSTGKGAEGNGGQLNITAGSLVIEDNASIKVSTVGKGNVGNISITTLNQGKNTVSLNKATISSDIGLNGEGNGGNILISTGKLSLDNDSSISAGTLGKGSAGTVTVTAKDAIDLNRSNIISTIGAGGNSQGNINPEYNITLSGESLSLKNGASVQTSSKGIGNAGNIKIDVRKDIDVAGDSNGFVSGIRSSLDIDSLGKRAIGNAGSIDIMTNSLSVKDKAVISAETSGEGNVGNINITAKDRVLVDNASIANSIEAGGVATLDNKGGNINLSAGSLLLQNGGTLQTVTSEKAGSENAGIGNAGSLEVNVTGRIDISGKNVIPSGIYSSIQEGAKGNGGRIGVTAAFLSLKDGARIETATQGKGNAGNINIATSEQSDNVVSLNNAIIFNGVGQNGEGKGGNIVISTGNLFLNNHSSISAGTRGKGAAGTVAVTAKGAIDLDLSNIISTTGSNGDSTKEPILDSIKLSGESLSLKNGATIQTSTTEADPFSPTPGKGNAGNITIDVRKATEVIGNSNGFPSGILSSIGFGAEGKAGNIDITTNSLSVKDKAKISAETSGKGNTGNVNITAKDQVFVDNASIVSSIEPGGEALDEKGGSVKLIAESLSLQNGGTVQTVARDARDANLKKEKAIGNAGNIDIIVTGEINLAGGFPTGIFSAIGQDAIGKGGQIKITGGSLSLRDGASIAANTSGTGKAGNIIIATQNGNNTLALKDATITSSVGSSGIGDGGMINITTGALLLEDRSSISTQTLGKGIAGSVTTTTTGATLLDNSNIISTIAGGDSTTIIDGKTIINENIGNVNITSESLSLKNAATILTATGNDPFKKVVPGKGNAGNITIRVDKSIDVSGESNGFPGGIRSSISKGIELGNGGSIDIKAGSLLVHDGADVSAATMGFGSAGKITVNAADFIGIVGKNSSLSVDSQSSNGNAGTITTSSRRVILDQGGTINAQSISGKGGSVIIDNSGLLLLRNGSKIVTDAIVSDNSGVNRKDSVGGNIDIKSQLVLAILKENSDISATGTNGNTSSGNVVIESQGVFGLSYQPQKTNASDITATSNFALNTPGVDPGKNIGELPAAPSDASKQISQACATNQTDNKFVVTGRGGHPPNTDGQLTSETYWQDARDSKKNSSSVATTLDKSAQPAVGWVFDKQGNVTLLAHNSGTESTRLKITCPVSPKVLAGGTQQK